MRLQDFVRGNNKTPTSNNFSFIADIPYKFLSVPYIKDLPHDYYWSANFYFQSIKPPCILDPYRNLLKPLRFCFPSYGFFIPSLNIQTTNLFKLKSEVALSAKL